MSGEQNSIIVCKTPNDVPKELHWVILEPTSMVEKDYGRGYPEQTHNYMIYTAYLIKEQWEQEIKRRMSVISRSPFSAIEVKPAVIKTTISVTVS